ncbi:MAG: hypothetical protein MUE97_07635, partial [Phycisphaerales bacterium]|nr:hypothetical protein [Phycisphaerales bacterium]
AAPPLLSSLPAESPAAEGVNGSRGQYELTDGFSIAGSASDVTLAGAAGSARRTTMQMMEVSAQLDAIKLEDLTLSLVTGVYYAAEGRPDARPDNEELTPVIGPSLRLRNTQGLGTLRLMALADASGANEDFMELRIDQVWRLTSQANLSLGYQYQRSIFSDTPALAGRAGNAREAVTLELSLKF